MSAPVRPRRSGAPFPRPWTTHTGAHPRGQLEIPLTNGDPDLSFLGVPVWRRSSEAAALVGVFTELVGVFGEAPPPLVGVLGEAAGP